MKRFTGILIVVIFCLVSGVFISGCTDSSSSDNSEPSVSVTETTATGALYSAGDIVKNPKSSSTVGLLIIGYNAATSMYERAYIYPNADGSWGYRLDTKTDTIDRSVIEKVYTEKIRTVEVSAVPIGIPSAATTTTVSRTTIATTATTSATATTTTSALPAPRIDDITPAKGTAGTTVTISELSGKNFVSGANVSLKKSSTTIVATNVDVDSSSVITCKFVIPAGTDSGYWDVIVTNPDKKYDTYETSFYIIKSDVSATTTTSSTSMVTISSIQDPILVTGGGEGYKSVSILGTNLSVASNMKLTGSSTIVATSYAPSTSTSAIGYFTIPAGNVGTYYVSLVDSSGTVLATSTGTLTIQ
ncbi:MAG: hypothetical protein M0Q92_13255 [Methanoregula sp.]|jgi:hypothetical protein|nr:hypothetical protein [Methanoregula sp.]